jgi:ribosome-associated protein
MSLPSAVEATVRAALEKKAEDAVVLDLRPTADFTDFFVLLSGGNQRQLVAIADAVREVLREQEGWRPTHVEGYPRQEWILLDYDRFVVHVFTPATRAFYDLERLWGAATRVEVDA